MKEFIVWRDEWLLQIEKFDGDHKEMVRLVNLIASTHSLYSQPHETSSTKPDIDLFSTLLELFNQLLSLIRGHFEQEEAFMIEIDFPDFNAHKTEHKLQMASFVSMRRQIENKQLITQNDLQGIKSWFFDHVVGEDRRYAEHFFKTQS